METKIPELRRELLELTHLSSAANLLGWDQMANMTSDHVGHDARATTLASLSELCHRRFISREMRGLIQKGEMLLCAGFLNRDDGLIIERTRKDFDKSKKLPSEFVAEATRLYGESYPIWVQAKEKSDFGMFAPNLERIIEIKRKEAELMGYVGSPYNALLDDYEEGLTVEKLDPIFSKLKDFLVPFTARLLGCERKIAPWPKDYVVDARRQEEYIRLVVAELGCDFNRGHLGVSAHPVSQSMHPTDARITVRYNEGDLRESLYSAIHEAGHAMYERNLLTRYYGTHLGESVSLGVHECNSRFWENMVGRSLGFWEHFYPLTKAHFPNICDIYRSPKEFYQVVNIVARSLIRTEADEVTYNLHIILRYEIERDLIEGRLGVDDLPRVWNTKTKEFFGLDVPDDKHGVLQDMHWSDGSFGYFPTYTLGNLYAAQVKEGMEEVYPDYMRNSIVPGNFNFILNWLRETIHIHGSRYEPEELMMLATGKPLGVDSFIKYITEKYSDLYGL